MRQMTRATVNFGIGVPYELREPHGLAFFRQTIDREETFRLQAPVATPEELPVN